MRIRLLEKLFLPRIEHWGFEIQGGRSASNVVSFAASTWIHMGSLRAYGIENEIEIGR